jgi:hypothetical protein
VVRHRWRVRAPLAGRLLVPWGMSEHTPTWPQVRSTDSATDIPQGQEHLGEV